MNAQVPAEQEVPSQLLDVHAIADARDFYRALCFSASDLLERAPIHHFGRDYESWKRHVAAWQVEYVNGGPCKHPQEWRTGTTCGCCLEEIA